MAEGCGQGNTEKDEIMRAQNTKKAAARERVMVPASEEDQIARTVREWLNTFEPLPAGAIRYVQLLSGVPGMTMRLEESTYKTSQYILGGYEAQMRFSINYRIQPGDSVEQRLTADETLNAIGDWACDPTNLLTLGERCRALKIVTDSRAKLSDEWDDGDEDHKIILTLTYEVI